MVTGAQDRMHGATTMIKRVQSEVTPEDLHADLYPATLYEYIVNQKAFLHVEISSPCAVCVGGCVAFAR